MRDLSEISCRFVHNTLRFSTERRMTQNSDGISFRYVVHYIWSIALYGDETWTLRKSGQKCLDSFEIWCWRRMENISWTDRVRNEEVLHRIKEERNIIHTVQEKEG